MEAFALTHQQPSEQPAKENRFDRAAQRIEACALEMGIDISEAEVTKFAIVYLGMMDDARELLKIKLGGQFVTPKT